MNATPRGPIAEGQRFGSLIVLDILTGSQAGDPQGATYCRVRCDCGVRKTVRARHLRAGGVQCCASDTHRKSCAHCGVVIQEGILSVHERICAAATPEQRTQWAETGKWPDKRWAKGKALRAAAGVA